MEDDFISRLKVSVGGVWVGVHLIYLSCINVSADNDSNPVWIILRSMVVIEKYLLIATLVFGVIFVLYCVIESQQMTPLF